ncbi:MAG TPA: hypothetical protein VG993_10800 [Actinomycetota bacterium]|nr:hypothetical protein [Actinomycetota bacterium]
MRRSVKFIVWVLVFAACAAVGAVVAANTNPFPPGVDDPGVRVSDGATPSEDPGGSWLARINARTYHDLFVGGRCAASWRIDVGIPVGDGPIDGAGAAMLKGQLRCDETTAQVQAQRIDLSAVGVARDGELRFRLEETGRDPAGSQELSGFLDTIPRLRLRMPARDGATATFDVEFPDGGQGTFGSAGTVILTQATA